MAAMQGGISFETIAAKWLALAQRRLAYVRDLEHSGRWERYYTREEYALRLREAERAVMLWARLAGQPISPSYAGGMRPAA